jgi:hypothetical protein
VAKAKAAAESKSSVFKRLFDARRDLLQVPSIDEIMKMYEAEIGKSANDKDRQVAANIKSRMRKKLGMRRGRRGRKRRAGRPAGTPAMATVARASASMLALEDSIDDCIYLARKMETDRLDDVVRLLRRARNHLIVMTGAK